MDNEKSYNMQYHLWFKIFLSTLVVKMKLPDWDREFLWKCYLADVMLNGEMLNTFPLKSEAMKFLLLLFPFSTALKSLVSAIGQKKY